MAVTDLFLVTYLNVRTESNSDEQKCGAQINSGTPGTDATKHFFHCTLLICKKFNLNVTMG